MNNENNNNNVIPTFNYEEEMSMNTEYDVNTTTTTETKEVIQMNNEYNMVIQGNNCAMIDGEYVRVTEMNDEMAIIAYNMVEASKRTFVKDAIRGIVGQAIVTAGGTPRDATIASVVIMQRADAIMNGDADFVVNFTHVFATATANDMIASVSAADMIDTIIASKVMNIVDGAATFGYSVINSIKSTMTSAAPFKVTSKNTIITRKNRVNGYSQVKHGKNAESTIHYIESSKFTVSDVMIRVSDKVHAQAVATGNVAVTEKMRTEQYVIDGSKNMNSSDEYVAEFKMDNRGRMYQMSTKGPNGQTSDMSRAFMDFAGIEIDYTDIVNVANIRAYMIAEMGDMVSGNIDIEAAIAHIAGNEDMAARVVAKYFNKTSVDGNAIPKVWNFVKFAMIIWNMDNNNTPYIGIAVGYDAKCSGPQIASIMTGATDMMQATGVRFGQVTKDAYEITVENMTAAGIMGMTRATVKKSFMAVFYGAGYKAMSDVDTITQASFDVIWAGIDMDDAEAVDAHAKKYHDVIINSFGPEISSFKKEVARAGSDWETNSSRYVRPIKHVMADGFEVDMKYKVAVNFDGSDIKYDKAAEEMVTATPRVVVRTSASAVDVVMENVRYNSDRVDFDSYSQKGFVNMIQATDAQVARTIADNCQASGVKHFIGIHDCFRVSVNDVAKLEDAITQTYQDIFGTATDKATAAHPHKDIIGNYFKASAEACAPEYAYHSSMSQFFGNTTVQTRRNQQYTVNGVTTIIKDVFADFANTEYFGK